MFFRNRKRDLKKGLKEFRKTPEAVLVDVRSIGGIAGYEGEVERG